MVFIFGDWAWRDAEKIAAWVSAARERVQAMRNVREAGGLRRFT